MSSPIATAGSAGRVALVADLVLSLVALWFVLPKSFVPASPGHYWTPEILPTARYLSCLFGLIVVLSVAGWVSRIARLAILIAVALLALKALNDFRLAMQFVASTDVSLVALVSSGGFWLDLAFGLLPAAWFVLHLRLFIR